MSTTPYQPDRSILAKIDRRLTQWRAAAPTWIAPGAPTLSITFDDFPASAVEKGAAILQRAGVTGTFYACSGFHDAPTPFGHGYTRDHLQALTAAGHEIACHTFSHQDCAQIAPAETAAQCDANARAMAALGVERLQSFAFPYGEATVAAKRLLATRFSTGRGVLPGLNLGRSDRMQLRSLPLFGPDADSALLAWLARAKRAGAWITVFTHDVAETPSPWGVTPAALARFVEAAQKAGFAIAPVAAVAQTRLAERAP